MGDALQAGVFVEQAASDGHWFMGLMVAENNLFVKVGLCTPENADAVINGLVDQLRAGKGELKKKASGLVVAQEVPNGLRKPSQVGSAPGRTPPRK